MGCLGSMHHREDLISRLQDEVRAWDQEFTAADDGRQCTLAGQWQVTEGAANRLGPGMHLLFYQRILPLAQLEQRHHITQGHLLRDEMSQHVRLIEGHIHAHSRGEQPGMLRCVHPGQCARPATAYFCPHCKAGITDGLTRLRRSCTLYQEGHVQLSSDAQYEATRGST